VEINDDKLFILDEPTNYMKAISNIDSEKWLEAMKSKMDYTYTNYVWTLVDSLEEIKPIRCEWVFKKKTSMNGNIQTYKARLIYKGYIQRQGVDFNETFSIVAMLKSISIFYSCIPWLWYLINGCQDCI